MTVTTTVIIKPHTGTDFMELIGQLSKSLAKIQSMPGVQDATLSAVTAGGPATNQLVIQASTENWEAYGLVQEQMNSDPEWIALLLESGKLANWETYVGQTIDMDLLPAS